MSEPERTLRHRLTCLLNRRSQQLYPEDPDPFNGLGMGNSSYSERYPQSSWLSDMINIPYLDSDVLIVLDCFVEELIRPDAPDNIPFVLDGDNSWARYLALFAGYTNPSTILGRLSKILMSLLEELATSRRFYAREGLITSKILREKLEREVRFENDLNLCWFGNDNKDFIHLSPL